MRRATLAIYALSGGIVILAAYYGVTRSLGAHPFWDTQVAVIGATIGLGLALILWALRWRWPTRLFTFLVLLALSSTAAHQGRLLFAASFAENTLAGQFWYFGWIASTGSATGLIAALLTPQKMHAK